MTTCKLYNAISYHTTNALLFQNGVSSLIIATQEGHFDTVKLLVESGADLDDREEVCVYLCV